MRKKYISKIELKRRKKKLKGYTIGELKELVINLTHLEKAPYKYILERDNYNCRFCGNKEDLQVHHITPRSLEGTNHELNLITTCRNCHSFLHLNPFGRLSKAELVKNMVVRKEGKTFSRKGNKWGRKKMPIEKSKKIIELIKEGMSYREIAAKLKVSIGKISEISKQKEIKEQKITTIK